MSRIPFLSDFAGRDPDTTQRRAAAPLPKVFNDIFHDEPSRYLLACLDPVSAARLQLINKTTRTTTKDLWASRTNRNQRTEKNPYLTQVIETQKLAISVLRSKPGDLRRIPTNIDGQLASIGNTSAVLSRLGLTGVLRRPESGLQIYAQRAFLQSEIQRVIKTNNNSFYYYRRYTSISKYSGLCVPVAVVGLVFGVGLTALANANLHYNYDKGLQYAAIAFAGLLIVSCILCTYAERRATFFRNRLSTNRSQYASVIAAEEEQSARERSARDAVGGEERMNRFHMTV